MNIPAKLMDHLLWADAQALTAIASIDAMRAERAQAARLYAHLAGAEHICLARLEGRRPVHPVWPELSIEAAAARKGAKRRSAFSTMRWSKHSGVSPAMGAD